MANSRNFANSRIKKVSLDVKICCKGYFRKGPIQLIREIFVSIEDETIRISEN